MNKKMAEFVVRIEGFRRGHPYWLSIFLIVIGLFITFVISPIIFEGTLKKFRNVPPLVGILSTIAGIVIYFEDVHGKKLSKKKEEFLGVLAFGLASSYIILLWLQDSQWANTEHKILSSALVGLMIVSFYLIYDRWFRGKL